MDLNLDVLRHMIGTLVLENLSLKGQVESLRRMLPTLSPEVPGLTSVPVPPGPSGGLDVLSPTEPPSAGS